MSSLLLASCEFGYQGDRPDMKKLGKEIDSLTRVRDSLLIVEKKLDSPVEYVYYYRSETSGEEGLFWSKEILHCGELIKGPFPPEDDENPIDIVKVISEGQRIKTLK